MLKAFSRFSLFSASRIASVTDGFLAPHPVQRWRTGRGLCTQSGSDNAATEEDGCDGDTAAPLHGIRVLDLTRILAGPLCTMLLADMGAEVIKIEKPGEGDETRRWGPPFVQGVSCYFLAVNRNKQSVAVDISRPEGSHLIRQLAGQCDVLMHNFLPGKLEKYGLGYSDLKQANRQIIYCSITGYGEDGPYRHRGGYDVIASAIGGMMHITGPQEGEPCKIGTAMTDISTGLYAHGAILAALLRRNRSGEGAYIQCNLLATQVANLVNLASNYLNTGVEPRRWGTAHESIVPYQSFRTKDDEYLVVGAGSDAQFTALCQLLQVDYANQPAFRTNADRVAHRDHLISLLTGVFQQKTLAEWLTVLRPATFPYGPVNSFQRVFADPQVQWLRLVEEVEHPVAGRVRMVGAPVRWAEEKNGFRPRVRRCPPGLGEHTDAVLTRIAGVGKEELRELRERGVVA
ncbi:succinate--hydroxymethylglutarate CoA-transferase-like [Paramacrobiotus metropolitanus]|uniref:succinate--hydroxymethylglutarate CoA-transferase-like n=1 Tax=Paramacrobiotus metropolitanus TaxID=2943436 RepID=UPI002445F732|nr:succinate--hydroxymethylglutarate CoA-transferase-like [Paramacrobiotus metropolitanus]